MPFYEKLDLTLLDFPVFDYTKQLKPFQKPQIAYKHPQVALNHPEVFLSFHLLFPNSRFLPFSQDFHHVFPFSPVFPRIFTIFPLVFTTFVEPFGQDLPGDTSAITAERQHQELLERLFGAAYEIQQLQNEAQARVPRVLWGWGWYITIVVYNSNNYGLWYL